MCRILFVVVAFVGPSSVKTQHFLKREILHHAVVSSLTVVSVCLSIFASLGLCLYLGVKFNNVVQTLALVLLGIGLDDGFVIASAYAMEDPNLSIKDRISLSLRHAGSSITVTSGTLI